jgi:hypothetical protein
MKVKSEIRRPKTSEARIEGRFFSLEKAVGTAKYAK